MAELTLKEREQARQTALKEARRRLEDRRPEASHYQSGGREARLIGGVLLYSKAAVPVIAVLAAVASAVRTVQVVSSIYTDAGSHPVGVLVAALAFTLAIEGTLFTLALASEGEALRRRAARASRHVGSLRGLWYGVLVRVGVRPALRWDQMPESSGRIGIVLVLALLAALATNLYLGMQPVLQQVGANSLQSFIAGLWDAPANVQMTFIVDLVLALFAPLVAFAAGHLTARYASEIAESAQAGRLAFERDLESWRMAYADPLATDEGGEVLAEHLEYKRQVKEARHNPFGNTAATPDAGAGGLMTAPVSANGHAGSGRG